MQSARMTFGSLFAGIGGFDLGLERAGMKCRWQVEIDQHARRILEKHWPYVRRWDDVRTFPPRCNNAHCRGVDRYHDRFDDGYCDYVLNDWRVDLICGGFPCQDISNAGKRAGIEGERSGLWSEYARIIGQLRPRYALVENVAALLTRGMGRVLGDLSSLGYDAEWDVIPACAVGAPFVRDRVFVVAERAGDRRRAGRPWRPVGDTEGLRQPTRRQDPAEVPGSGWWANEPELDRLVFGVSPGVDRLRGLGNAVVPQVAEWIGRRVLEHD